MLRKYSFYKLKQIYLKLLDKYQRSDFSVLFFTLMQFYGMNYANCIVSSTKKRSTLLVHVATSIFKVHWYCCNVLNYDKRFNNYA